MRFAELLAINFLICGLLLTTTTFSTSCSSSSSCRPPCKKLKRVSGMRATSPGWDLKQMRVGEMTALWLLSSLSAGCCSHLERCSVTGLCGAAWRRRGRRSRKPSPLSSILVITGSSILTPLPYLTSPSQPDESPSQQAHPRLRTRRRGVI